jgi:hypothetical protein
MAKKFLPDFFDDAQWNVEAPIEGFDLKPYWYEGEDGENYEE